MFTLRPAQEIDFPAIRALIHAVQINPMGLDWKRFIVACKMDNPAEIIGCGQLKPHGDGSTELASIAVISEWRGRGVARAIILALIAAHDGPLYLTCRAPLGTLYEKFGFSRLTFNEMPAYFRRIARLAALLRWLHLVGDELLVMRRLP